MDSIGKGSLSVRDSARDRERYRRSRDSSGTMSNFQEASSFGYGLARLHFAPQGRSCMGKGVPCNDGGWGSELDGDSMVRVLCKDGVVWGRGPVFFIS